LGNWNGVKGIVYDLEKSVLHVVDSACRGRLTAVNEKLKACYVLVEHRTEIIPAAQDGAIDQNGKPLAGAAKTSFVKKCVTDAGKT
jgi:hypothetical protein